MKRRRTKKKTGPGAGVLVARWIARLSSLAGVVILVLYVWLARLNPAELPRIELIIFLFMPVGIGLGYLISWGWEGTGPIISLVCLIGYYVSYYLTAHTIFLDFLFLAIPPVLFLISRAIALRRG